MAHDIEEMARDIVEWFSSPTHAESPKMEDLERRIADELKATRAEVDPLLARLRAVEAERDMWKGIAESQTELCVRRKAERDAARAEFLASWMARKKTPYD